MRSWRLGRSTSVRWQDVRNVEVDDRTGALILRVCARDHIGSEWWHDMSLAGEPVYRIRDLMIEAAERAGASVDRRIQLL